MQQLANISGFMSLCNQDNLTPNRLYADNPNTPEARQGKIYIPKNTSSLTPEQRASFNQMAKEFLETKKDFNKDFDYYRKAMGNLDPKEEDKSLWSLFYHNSIGLAKVNNYSNQLLDALNAMGAFADNPSIYQRRLYRPRSTNRG